ncbi:phosphoribosylglycinamide formyltransferase [Halolactibacillus alkaliphilus]|uniref:Phosphoribosylglycinamide formyltransferase n=1 Tax=Halolactibacillus alkaliphilus TaxID=442899 RepID=A0A511X2L6_9BACI|nr:phosphoribosylglycinamide formyltransferase [Halolactibacillus alkaliphilus]GEN57183.1 phosphoribosylglycinamide formyltransferase [Halolactibacillus alkaliphilus]GGN72707.1 phosphoribosylglycinamide formyltransferase [Halolactibacillus alkaliphilus]
MKTTKKLAVFASGTGSNFIAIQEAIEQGTLDATIALVVSDVPTSAVIEKAKKKGLKTFVFNPQSYSDKEAFETEIVEALSEAKVDWVILAGYMRLVGPTLLSAYEGKIVNIHPSLLPSFKGLDAIGQAFDAGVKITGVTIHFVDEGMDTGRIIAQEAVTVKNSSTRVALQKDIQAVEHRLYPETINYLLQQ